MNEVPNRGNDPFAEKMRRVLSDWAARALVDEDWTLEWDSGDGAHRVMFTARTSRPSLRLERRWYSFSETEFCHYVLGLADLCHQVAGPAAVELADASREEVEW